MAEAQVVGGVAVGAGTSKVRNGMQEPANWAAIWALLAFLWLVLVFVLNR